MPPDDRLTPEEIADLERWVLAGAVWPNYQQAPKSNAAEAGDSLEAHFGSEEKSYWAFQPVVEPSVPEVQNTQWPSGELDRFILAKLEDAGLSPAPAADKLTLLRRATFDLTGLPPAPEDISQFVADDSPDAFAKVLDRLLASPRYGERWGQHWLDVVRFAESAGHDGNNAYLHAWRYRDYVIKAMNEDKPYDQFIIEQLAGDLLPKTGNRAKDFDQLAATGFLQVGPKPVVMRDKQQMALDIADEQLSATGIAFMALTIGCARCHDHKFDPIPTADYYSLAGIFMSTAVMADEAPDSKWLEFDAPDLKGQAVKVMAVRDRDDPRNMRIHRRGSYHSLGPEAPRRFLQILAGAHQKPIDDHASGRMELARWIASPDHPLTARVMVNRLWQHHFGRGLVATSGNFGRLGSMPTHPKLLDWLACRFVERGWSLKAMHRLIMLSSAYQQASTASPAGLAHDPEDLLLSRMPRRRLSAEEIRDALLAAAGQLDATMGGSLFTEGYTPVDASRELYTIDISGKETYAPFEHPRRSVYLPVLRNSRPEALKLFDVANEHEPTSVRGETTVAPQALYLLNSPFVRSMAGFLAAQILRGTAAAATTHDERLKLALDDAYRLALGRKPTSDEIARTSAFIDEYIALLEAQEAQPPGDVASAAEGYDENLAGLVDLAHFYAWRAVCQALFCRHEFIYVE
jgi:hypothetical protein